ILGIKEASGSYSQWLDLASRMNLKQKSLLAGDDDAFAPILSLGGSGIISASANVAPKEFVQLYDLFRVGKQQEAFQLQSKLLPLVKALFAETSPAPVKYALHCMGYADPYLRLPLVESTAATQSLVKTSLQSLGIHS